MKTPRIDAFVPKNKPVLDLKSTLDHMPVIEKPKPAEVSSTSVYPVPPVRVVPPVSPGLSKKRIMKQRHPFDIYQDQYDALKDIAAEERKQGGIGSMSAMVREALDKLIAEKTGR